jgi:hypothetical protein
LEDERWNPDLLEGYVGFTPLMAATQNDDGALVDLLPYAGADSSVAD